jgi:Leucine-rich repeat (LRR) protein
MPHHYQLRALPPDLCANGYLQELYLANHKIDTWPLAEGFQLTQLTTLNLDCNRLREVGGACLGLLVRLATLSLAHNHLTELPDAVSLLTQLRVLNVAHNDLEELPDALQVGEAPSYPQKHVHEGGGGGGGLWAPEHAHLAGTP